MDRRTFVLALAAAPFCVHAQTKGRTMKDIDALQKNWKTFLPAGATVPAAAEPLKLSKDEWKKRLPAQSYNVLREEGTERAGTSALNAEKRAGIYACAGCGLPLFSSATKFDSGTGWPSFWKPLPNAIATSRDSAFGMVRVEEHCRRCGGHLGHIFDDGPPPTGKRHCLNGLALTFKPATA